jgi:hypothetical protein
MSGRQIPLWIILTRLQGEVFIWQSTMKQVPIRRVNLEEGLIGAYAIYLEQSSRTVRNKIEQLAIWPQLNQDKDPLVIKNEICKIMCGMEFHQNPLRNGPADRDDS